MLVIAMVLASTGFPRLMLLGGPPATDEGFYAYSSLLIHHGMTTNAALPDVGTLALYPMLLSWVFAFDANAMILLRIADLAAAMLAALLLYRVLEHESGSSTVGVLLSLAFVFTMNQPIFIQFGFKNSITAAFVPLLLAVRIGQTASDGAKYKWLLAGGLAALAVLLRETFVPFAALGFIALLVSRGPRVALQFAAGGVSVGAAVIGGILAARGGIANMMDAYRNAGAVYASVADQRIALLINNGWAAIRAAAIPLGIGGAALAVVSAVTVSGNRQAISPQAWSRMAFWLAAATLPLIEPITKSAFPYHFAVCLPGLAGLCARVWREASAISPGMANRLTIAAAMTVLPLAPKFQSLLEFWPDTRATLAAVPNGEWPAQAIARSNYLLAAQAIRKVMPVGGTLSVSGFMYTLYPLTRHLPPAPGLDNLTATFIRLGLSEAALQAALVACPPDVVMSTTRNDWPGGPALLSAIEASGLYERTADVPISTDRSYGGFGGAIFRRTEPRPCTERAATNRDL